MIDCSAIEVMGVLALVPAIYTGPAMAYRTLEETGVSQNRADHYTLTVTYIWSAD